jgi:hypothetical protein
MTFIFFLSSSIPIDVSRFALLADKLTKSTPVVTPFPLQAPLSSTPDDQKTPAKFQDTMLAFFCSLILHYLFIFLQILLTSAYSERTHKRRVVVACKGEW